MDSWRLLGEGKEGHRRGMREGRGPVSSRSASGDQEEL